MPQDLSQSVSGSTELVFPDDADKKTYSLRERSVYDAGEVRNEIEADIPQYGSWLPVTVDGDDAWLVAPSELRSELVNHEIQAGERFQVEKMVKSGRQESDPYSVVISLPDREATPEDQTSLA